MLDATESDLGGYKRVTVAVKAKGTPEPGEAPFARLKFEGGVHRVQRVPVTESQGRIHTSAAGVLVLPEAEDGRRRRSTRTTCASTSSGRPGPAARASTPPTRPCASPTCRPASSCQLPEREEPAAEQGAGDAHPAGPAARRRAGRPPTPRRPTRAGRRSARSTAPSGSAPTTSRRTGSPTTASGSRRTTSTRCWTATLDDVVDACVDADVAARLAAVERRPVTDLRAVLAEAASALTEAGCRVAAQRRRDAARATCSGRAALGCCSVDRARRRPDRMRSSALVDRAPPGSRCST